LKTFTTPELLDGNNQYFCSSHCNKSCDAHKGYLFKKLPNIFIIQLKRFDSDWETNRRYKLNDRLNIYTLPIGSVNLVNFFYCRIYFPVALDMNPYMDKSSSESNNGDAINESVNATKPTFEENATQPRLGHSRPGVSLEDEENVEIV
jgi:ubiquitin C-terminal hydrolase